MTDITITPASVLPGAGSSVQRGAAGETITAGQVVYKDSATQEYMLADCDSATAAAKAPTGIALNGAADGQPLSIVTAGDVTLGAVLTAGTAYYLSATAGGIAPLADLGSGDDVVLLGVATSTTSLKVAILVSGVAL